MTACRRMHWRPPPSVTAARVLVAAYLALSSIALPSSSRASALHPLAQDACAGAPGAPSGLTVAVIGTSVNVGWKPPVGGCKPTSYLIEAGSAPGLSDFPPVGVSSGTATTVNDVPEGLYFVRVRAINDGEISEASNEVQASIGDSPCGGLPPPPTGIFVGVSGTTMTVVWNPSTRSPSDYFVEVRSTSDVASGWTGSAEPSLTLTTRVGTYFVRVRPRNPCGEGTPTNEVVARTGGHPAVPDVVVAPRTADRNTYFPTVERLRNGHLIVVFYDSPEHVSPRGRISLVRSVDGGRTWSAPTVAVDSPLDDRDPSLVQTRAGTLLLSYFSAGYPGAPQGAGVYVARSDDEGATWSAPVPVGTRLPAAGTTSKIVELGNGDLLIPIYGMISRYARSAVVRSTDGGLTWPRASEVEIESAARLDLVEPALVTLDGGRLLMIMRTERSDFVAMESRSTDEGRTWSEPVKTGIKALASDLLAIPSEAVGGPSAVHTWGDWSRRFGDSRATVMQRIDVSGGAGHLRYGEPHLVYNSHCDDAAAPSSVVLGDGRLFTVFYDACSGYIGGNFVRLTDLPR